MSSISGSDSEDEESHSENDSDGADGGISYSGRLSTRVLLQNSQGQYLCLYRCAVQKRTVSALVQLCTKSFIACHFFKSYVPKMPYQHQAMLGQPLWENSHAFHMLS